MSVSGLIPTGEYADELAAKFGPYYLSEDIPADTYQGQAQPSPQVVVPNVLIVRSDMPEQLQQDITRTIFENKAQLATVHPAANDLDHGGRRRVRRGVPRCEGLLRPGHGLGRCAPPDLRRVSRWIQVLAGSAGRRTSHRAYPGRRPVRSVWDRAADRFGGLPAGGTRCARSPPCSPRACSDRAAPRRTRDPR
jgi:hypothetical protein